MKTPIGQNTVQRVDGRVADQHAGQPSFLEWMIPAILCLIYLVQCGWFVRTQSMVYDEPVHIFTGLEAWRHHRFAEWNDQPPLVRMLSTVPFISRGWQVEVEGDPEGFQASRISPDPVTVAVRARFPVTLLGLALGILLWVTARRLLTTGAAHLALALFVFTPAVIANFSLATTDGAGTLFIFAAAARLIQWRRCPSWGQTALLGVMLGLLLLAKFYTLPFFLLALGAMLVLKPRRVELHPRDWNWGKASAAAILALLLVWAGYWFHVSRLTVDHGRLVATFPNREPIIKDLDSHHSFHMLVPAGEYLEGLRTVWFHNRRGHAAFFLGQVSQHGGWKSFYPVVILLKWPTVVLVLFAVALVGACGRQWRVPSEWWVLGAFPIVYFLFAIFSRIDIGDRHVLPVYPFLLLFMSGLYEWARGRPLGRMLLCAAVLANAADGLRYAPDYLSYFMPFLRPADSYQFLTASSLDWGQGLVALREYERTHPGETIWLAYFGSVQPEVYGIHARKLGENERATGTVMVSATHLSGQYLHKAESYRWVLEHPRVEILNHSLYVFRVPRED